MKRENKPRSLLPPAHVVKAQREHEREFYRRTWESFAQGMRRWAKERK